MNKPRIAYVTYVVDPADPDIDLDKDLFLAALAARGLDASAVVWNDPEADWASFDLALVRSTWDYTHQRDAFLAWARSVAAVTRLENPFEILEENTDKRYLRVLSGSGVPVIPTVFLERPSDLKKEFQDAAAGWVVKPTIGAGARGASRQATWDGVMRAVDSHFEKSRVPLMLQPYLAEVDSTGEIAVMCCRGEPTHAVVKRPALSDGGHGDFSATAEITTSLRGFVRKVLAQPAARGSYADLLYARVDVVPRDGGFMLMELEATEPFLFLPACEKAAGVFAGAVAGLFGT